MSSVSLNVSLSPEQAALINREVDAGNYTSASEVVREALRQWLDRRIAVEVAEFERLSSHLWERETTKGEETAILGAQKVVRAEIKSERTRRSDRR